MPYNVTEITNTTSFIEVMQFVNQSTDNWFGIFIVFGTFIVMLLPMLYANQRISSAFMVASVITAIVSLLMRAMGLINDLVFFIVLIVLAISLIAIYYDE